MGHWLVLGVWVLWLLLYWRGGSDIIRDLRAAASPQDRAHLLILTGIGTALLVSSVGYTLTVQTPHTLAPLGALLVIVGVAGMFYSRRYLSDLWTAENALQPDHRIMDTGPYAYVRHPIYAAALLFYVGVGVVFPAWWNLVGVGIVVLVYVLKTTDEDRFLAASLSGYTDYQVRVPYRLLPRVW